MKNKIQSVRGTRDFYPQQMLIRRWLYKLVEEVSTSFGYEEYDGPFLENFDLYAAKSGEELVNEQLYSFTDRGNRKVAIRPEMTPTLARMVAKKLNELAKPIRWFSIANFWRYEKPQRGRGREFFQLNADIFGFEGIEADFEVISLAIDLMKSFDAKEGMFEIRINDRKLMDDFYRKLKLNESQIKIVNKAIDKKTKISEEEFEEWLADEAKMSKPQLEKLVNFMENPYATLEE